MKTANALKLVILDESSRWSEKDIVLLLLGTVISFYATVVFERYKRFAEMMRGIARNRELSASYPPESALGVNLESSYRQMELFREFLAETMWNLEAEGHLEAARKVAQLKSFMERAAGCVAHMLGGSIGELSIDQYLKQFNDEYQQIFAANFQCFEEHLHPSWRALLQVYPHPTLPGSRVSTDFDYFDKLLKMRHPPFEGKFRL
jgi:hypothetical protein